MSNITNAHKTSRPKIQGQAPLPLCYRGRMFPHFSLLPKQNRHLKTKIPKKQFPIPENPLKKRIQKTQSHLWYTDRFPYPPYKCSRIITAPTTIISHHQNAPKTPPQTTSNPPPTPGKIRQKNARNSIPPLRLLYMHNLFSKISLTYARIG